MNEERDDDLPPSQLKYQQWLQSKHVHVASNLVTTTNDTNLIVAGWGCVAKSDIEKGMVLFSIPREACFGATAVADNASEDDDDDDDDDDPTTRDTQMDMAMSILRCQQQNNKNETEDGQDWTPFLNLLTSPPHGLPWMWTPEFRQAVLRGTELERVVENKVKRISMEYEQIVKQQQQHELSSITHQEYVNACAIVSSHTNPWFGVSIVPFNTTLNWGKVPNVEFDLEEEEEEERRIVGRATCNIKKGQELFQAYGTSGASDSVADFVYRYGFAPSTLEECDGMDGDVVSIDVEDILSIVEETKKGKNHSSLNSETLNLKTRRQVESEGSDNPNPFASITNITQLSSRLEALKMSGALDESPWDGLQGHWTAEIGRPTESFLQTFRASSLSKNHPKRGRENESSSMNIEDRLAFDDGGLSKLVGIFLVLLADDAAWERASIALQNNFDNDHKGSSSSGNEADSCDSEAEDDERSEASDESRKDDISASILLSSLFNICPQQTEELLQVALHVGMGGNDPWRALLDGVANAIDTTNPDSRQKLKKRKIAQQQQEEEKKEDISNIICTRATPLTSTSSHVQKLKAAFEAANAALCFRRRKLIEGELSCQNILNDLVTKQANNKDEESYDFSSEAKVEAIKTVCILRDVEKTILEQAIEILEIASLDVR